MPRVLVIDNYDSFTYNLVQYLEELGARVEVVLNDALAPSDIAAHAPSGIVISPGPKTPEAAGISVATIQMWGGRTPILGVCLGHQAIAAAYGGRVARAQRLMHGKTSPICHDGTGLYAGLPSPFEATRYHSWIVTEPPSCLVVSAWTAEGEIMGLRHREWAVEGVQFHPESFLSLEGKRLLGNWVTQIGR